MGLDIIIIPLRIKPTPKMRIPLLRALLLIAVITPYLTYSQDETKKPSKVKASLYGFVRGDASFDTRMNASAYEGLFLLYPLDVKPDANGEDLNKVPSSGFYSFNTRVGVKVAGLDLFKAAITGNIEMDLAGFSSSQYSSYTMLRIRQAYIKMQWPKSTLTVGQAWHPFFGPVIPNVISISVGSPFNPFNRSPQLRYDYQAGRFQLTGAALYHFQFTALGPAGKTNIYHRQAILPELYGGFTYSDDHFVAGAGLNYLTIRPRVQSTVEVDPGAPLVYKVNESLGSLSTQVYGSYTKGLFTLAAKAIYGKNLVDQTMIGGYGIRSIDPLTGRQEYANFSQVTTWINATYGKKYMVGLFGGYSKSLGSDKALVPDSPLYVDGAAIDYLYRACGTFSYNITHFMIGVEYEMTAAAYGDGPLNYNTGRYSSSHEVINHRIVAAIAYLF